MTRSAWSQCGSCTAVAQVCSREQGGRCRARGPCPEREHSSCSSGSHVHTTILAAALAHMAETRLMSRMKGIEASVLAIVKVATP